MSHILQRHLKKHPRNRVRCFCICWYFLLKMLKLFVSLSFMNLQGTIICNPGEVRNINSTVPAIVGDMWSFLGGYTKLTPHSGQVPDNIPSTELAANQKPSSSNSSHFWGNRCWVLEETVQRKSIEIFCCVLFFPVRFSHKERHTHTHNGGFEKFFWNYKLQAVHFWLTALRFASHSGDKEQPEKRADVLDGPWDGCAICGLDKKRNPGASTCSGGGTGLYS